MLIDLQVFFHPRGHQSVRLYHPELCLGVTSFRLWQHVTLYAFESGATSGLSLIGVIVLANKGDHYSGSEIVSILS